MSPPPNAPLPIPRPALARWIWERGLNWKQAGDYFGVSGEGVRLVCLPFSSPHRQIPRRAMMARIYELTGGEITPDSFHQLTTMAETDPAALAEAH